MSAVAEILEQVKRLEWAEQDELLDRLPTVAGRRIVKTPDTCFGKARIDGTRLYVSGLEAYRRMGVSDAELVEWFPTLRVADLPRVWAYVAAHQEEIDTEIRDGEADDETDPPHGPGDRVTPR